MQAQQISERARVFYGRLYNNIHSSRLYLSRPVRATQPPLWGFETSASIDAVARRNGYIVYKHNSTIPEVHLIGYEQTCMDKTVSFLESLALEGIFEECAFLAEGYVGKATLLSWVKPVTDERLNTVFNTYKLKPRGSDDLTLRERQYSTLDNIAALRRKRPKPEEEIRKKVLEAMSCVVQRERGYFLPAIIKQKQQGKPIIFLADIVHAVSFNLRDALEENKVKYAVFVPNPLS